MIDTREIRTLRAISWERAKGELQAMRHTYWSDTDSDHDTYERFTVVIKEFIKTVELEGLAE